MSSHRDSCTLDSHRAPLAEVTIEHAGDGAGRCVLDVRGELDPATEHQLTAFVDRMLRQDTPPPRQGTPLRVTLDLSSVTLCTAAGVRALVWARSAVTAHGGELLLRNPAPGVLKVLTITGDLDRFEIQTGQGAPV
jgi:anti-anti-sigma factor